MPVELHCALWFIGTFRNWLCLPEGSPWPLFSEVIPAVHPMHKILKPTSRTTTIIVKKYLLMCKNSLYIYFAHCFSCSHWTPLRKAWLCFLCSLTIRYLYTLRKSPKYLRFHSTKLKKPRSLSLSSCDRYLSSFIF